MIKLAIYSNIEIYADGLSVALAKDKDINVVGVVADNEQLDNLSSLDMILIDIQSVDNLVHFSRMIQSHTKLKLIVFALGDDDENYQWCLQSGVMGYLCKSASLSDLQDAVKTVANNRLYCSNDITNHFIKLNNDSEIALESDYENNYVERFSQLTRRETQILEYIVAGYPNKKIANSLNIQLSTVKNHVHSILMKVGVSSRMQLTNIVHSNENNIRREQFELAVVA